MCQLTICFDYSTYKISEELVVRNNCEIAQDAVLDFQPRIWNFNPNNFKCITLERSSRLIGNHAAICVPYAYKGNVLYSTDDGSRYLKDINIIKLIETGDNAGLPASEDKVTNGTALLIERIKADDESDSSVLNGFDFSGLDIMGAFDYGIKCINTDPEAPEIRYAETCIGGLIDGCRTSVYMDHYSDAHISALIQPRLSYMSENNPANPRYAEYGIHLVDSTEVDIRDSRIRNWDPSSEACSFSEEFQHVCMEGDCSGLSLDQSLCYDIDGYEIRDLIHTDSPINLCNMTVFEEPNTDYINYHDENAVEGLLYRDIKIHSDKDHPHYKPGELVKTTGTTSTCLIPCSQNTTIEVKNITFVDKGSTNRIAYYGQGGGCVAVMPYKFFNNDYTSYEPVTDGEYKFTVKKDNVKSIRFCCDNDNIGTKPTVIVRNIVNDEDVINTIHLKDGYLKDRTYVKAQYIYGLEKYIEDYLNENPRSETPSESINE